MGKHFSLKESDMFMRYEFTATSIMMTSELLGVPLLVGGACGCR